MWISDDSTILNRCSHFLAKVTPLSVRYLVVPDSSGGLNGSTQHFLEVYSQESENLKFLVGVDLSAALLCSDPTGSSRLGLRSSESIVVRVRLCFRSSRVARDSADHRSRLSYR